MAGSRCRQFSHIKPSITTSSREMSDYSEDLGPILDKLQLLLENLPNQLPLKPITGPDASHYASLIGFKPDNELVDLTGSKAGALNVHLERVFGYAARSSGDGILPILERGPAVCAMHDILSDYCNEFQNDNVLKKWAIDIAKGAEKVYNTYRVPVSFILVLIAIVRTHQIAENLQIPHVMTNTSTASSKGAPARESRTGGRLVSPRISQGGTGIGKKDPGSIFFLRPPSAGLTNYVIRHMS